MDGLIKRALQDSFQRGRALPVVFFHSPVHALSISVYGLTIVENHCSRIMPAQQAVMSSHENAGNTSAVRQNSVVTLIACGNHNPNYSPALVGSMDSEASYVR